MVLSAARLVLSHTANSPPSRQVRSGRPGHERNRDRQAFCGAPTNRPWPRTRPAPWYTRDACYSATILMSSLPSKRRKLDDIAETPAQIDGSKRPQDADHICRLCDGTECPPEPVSGSPQGTRPGRPRESSHSANRHEIGDLRGQVIASKKVSETQFHSSVAANELVTWG